MFRKATLEDIDRISGIYEEIHTEIEQGRALTGWVRGIYPTKETAKTSVEKGEMFVLELNGKIVAAAKINRTQEPEYRKIQWKYETDDSCVMVIHTLVVSPAHSGKGLGTEFVGFYEKYALENGCNILRMDTNEKNLPARALYKKLGYSEAGVVPTVFNGIPGVRLVCLEKKLK
jgi:GNAT superfamily N-acetyltransferase